MSVIEKKVDITLKDSKASLSSSLNFYVNDKIRLAFNIQEYDFDLVNGYSRTRKLRSVKPLAGTLGIETPSGIDTLEYVSVEGNTIYFELDNNYTKDAGTYKAQLFLTSTEGYRKALPPFSFTILNTINEELDGNPSIDIGSGGTSSNNQYATKEELETKADKNHSHDYNDLTNKPNIPSVEGLATEERVNELQSTLNEHLENHPTGGGGEKEFRLIREFTLEEDTLSIDITTDENGEPFELSEVYIFSQAWSTKSGGAEFSIRLNKDWSLQFIHGKALENGLTRVICSKFEIIDGMLLNDWTQHPGYANLTVTRYGTQTTLAKHPRTDSIKEIYLHLNNASGYNLLKGSCFKIVGR